MNNVTIVGNLGQDPEVKQLQNDKQLCNFSIATTDGYGDKKKTNWHNCTAFGKTAEIIGQYAKKGGKLAVNGYIDYREHEGKRYTQIIVNSFTFQNQKADSNTSQEPANNQEEDDDLPF